ncbi:MAG: malate dehydrogenase [Gammaproteobacteria bacterium]|jgi:malate dehydrogenase (oxaloacetate-decarboxylating)(NADP+)|nr:malate dehydrogenase [Gammaproteobacteria bacterium]MBT3489867.1 malate dehydrogenase [Gammaproteobacteria bacterium]MBT3719747.1 malate dehydrogenase [Gammaproteobacteria bacterium]MBT3844915.1 malate dehydrogenase [Gammaproteobacteria bacterium]MBT3894371.1 malate dehydrogenase [Gammaproteobacteria bacterium]
MNQPPQHPDDETLTQQALDYHSSKPAGKLAIHPTKPFETPYDLSLAYSPGVAAPVREIAANPNCVDRYTARGNLIAVITDGSAVLGLGNVGPLAAKPVMEGKAVLFKKFADIDVFDIEVEASSNQDFIETVARIAPTFGGINLEDISAPHCFEVERALIDRLNIPVFHDDQHGTAIIIAAGLLNALQIQGKSLPEARIVCLGAGAAAIASMQLLITLGACKENITLVDRHGVVHTGRTDLNIYKQLFARTTEWRSLADAMESADVFTGLSGANLVSPAMVQSMAPNPVLFALANPDPEIHPKLALSVRDDLIMATGRSDFPNQVNNVLCFPFIFRGALDAKATTINIEMKIAAVKALQHLTNEPIPDSVRSAYPDETLEFGPHYIIPKPLDPRLRGYVSTAVRRAAIESGVSSI